MKSVQTAQTQRNTTVVSTTQSAATLAQTTNTASNTTANALKVAVSSDTAAQTATQTVPGATLLATPELVSFQGAVAYEVSLDAGKVYVDANTGAVLYNTVAQAQAQPNVWQGEREGDRGPR